MADLAFHHGTRVFESSDTAVQVRTAQSAVVFLLGTAPDADASVFPLNKPILIQGSANYRIATKLGAAGTLKRELDAIFDQGSRARLGAYVYVCRVAEGEDEADTLSNLVGDAAALTGIHAAMKCESLYGRKLKPRLLIAPGYAGPLSTAGIATSTMTAQGSGYLVAPTVTVVPEAGNTPTVPARAVAVLGTGDQAGKIIDIVFPQPGEGYTDDDDGPTLVIGAPPAGGVQATATVTVGTVGNPLAHEMEGIGEKLRAVAFIDGPNTTDAAAVLAMEKYGTERIYMIDPFVEVFDTDLDAYISRPASGRFAGVQVRVDKEIGFYKSVSNEPIYGIDGVSRPISYGAQTNYLNENRVATVVSFGAGYRTWGNRTAADTFLAVRRTKDFVNEAIEDAYLAFVDRSLNDANLKFLVERGRAFLKTLEANGYILKDSGDVWIDADLNPPSELKQGRVMLSIKFEPPPPMEDIRVIAHENLEAYTLLIDRVNGALEAGSLSIG